MPYKSSYSLFMIKLRWKAYGFSSNFNYVLVQGALDNLAAGIYNFV